MKIFIIGAGKTGTTTIHAFLKTNNFKTTNHDPNFNQKIINNNDYNYDVFSAYPWTTFEKVEWANKKFKDALFIFTTYNDNRFLTSTINHDIRNYHKNTNNTHGQFKKYEDIKRILDTKLYNDNKIINYFKNKNNFLYINWDESNNYKKKICDFINIKSDINLEIKNESISTLNITNKDADSMNILLKQNNILKDIYIHNNNNTLTFKTKDKFYILYFLNVNLVKYNNFISISKYLFHDINNDFITKKILSYHNDKCNNKTSFRLEFFDNLFDYILPDYDLNFKNIIEFGPGDCAFLRYCDSKGSNCVSIDYDNTVKEITNFYGICHIHLNYTSNIINYSDIFKCYIKFDFIYGKSSIDISMPTNNLNYFIKNIKNISYDKTKLFYLTWISSNFDDTILQNNIRILKENDFNVHTIKKDKIQLFVYPFTINHVISKNINMPDKYFIKC